MEAPKHTCANCGAVLISAYCHDCGQRANTHRITLSHLIKHDLVHGIWHFERGLLFTLREAFLRPGHMAMDYIRGRRIRYYNFFYLLLIVIGIDALAAHYLKELFHIAEDTGPNGLVLTEDTADVSYYIGHYFKLLLFLLIPFFALCGLVSFRRLKLNFAEHAIIATNLLLTAAICYFFVIVGMYGGYRIESVIYDYFMWGLVAIAWLQPVRVYYQAAGRQYTIGGYLWRIVLWYACLVVLLFLVLLLLVLFIGRSNITLN